MKCLTRAAERVTRYCMTIAETMRGKLAKLFAPSELVIEDDSAKHAGHAGAAPGGETHFSVRIVSASFAGLSRVERQRRIHDALADELRAPVHALSLTTLTPDEAQRRRTG